VTSTARTRGRNRAAGPSPAPVRLLPVATAREATGSAALPVTVPDRGTSVEELLEEPRLGASGLARVLKDCRVARNGRYIRGPSARVRQGDELAIHPPFSGG
jgi:molybdopterin converting factor small subunit